MKIRMLIGMAAVAASAVPAWAETYYSQVVNNQGQSSFASPGVAGAWNTEPDGTGTSKNYTDGSGNVYVIRHVLRTPENWELMTRDDEMRFEGGRIMFKMKPYGGKVTLSNMVVPEDETGGFELGMGNCENTLMGNCQIGAGGRLTISYAPSDSRSLTLGATLTGTGTLVCSGGGGQGVLDMSAGTLTGFKGPIVVSSTGADPYVNLNGGLGVPDALLADGLVLSNKAHVAFALTNTTYTLPATRGIVVARGAVAQLKVPAGLTLTVAGPVSGNGTLVKTGAGKLVFSSVSPDFTGSIVTRCGATEMADGALPNATVTSEASLGADYYVSDGLVLQYDALEPGDDASVWKNLAATGAAYDLALPSWVTHEDGAFRSSAIRGLQNNSQINSSKTGTSPGFAAVDGITSETPATTVEIVMQRLAWPYTDNYYNLQSVLTTPRGSFGYRYNEQNGHYVMVPTSTTQLQLYNLRPGASAKALKTVTATLGVGQTSILFDGVDYAASNWGVDSHTSAWPDRYAFFGNLRTDVRICAIRLYNRRLTAEEIAANAALDGLRFHGRPLPAAVQLSIADIPEQSWNGLDDACPKVTVIDRCRKNRLLAQAVDYAVGYERNAGPGKGKVIVSGLGEYAGLEVTKEFSIRSAIEVTVQGDGRTARVSFPAANVARNLYVATATNDCGRGKADWPSVSLAATVPAGATEAKVMVPEGAGTAWMALRFFLSMPATSASYVTEGLVLHYDGTDNSVVDGVRTHLDAPPVLANLTGNGKDIPTPSFLDIEANAFYSKADKNRSGISVSHIPLVPTVPTELTVDFAAQRVRWVYSDNYSQLQSTLTTPLGTISYRKNNENGFAVVCYGYNADANLKRNGLCYWTYWPESSMHAADIHTLTARVRSGAASYFIDGGYRLNSENYTIGQNSGDLQEVWFDSNTMTVGTNFSLFSNIRADNRVFSVRLYNRKLARTEVARNAAVDAARFKGAEICAASDAVGWCVANPVLSGANATVSVRPARTARDLYIAWDAEDRGPALTNWARSAKAGTIPAGVSSAVVHLPSMAKPRTVARLFLERACDSSAYVKQGLVLQLDGVDNSVDANGVPYHDAAATTWADLSGNVAVPIPLPEWVTVESDAIFSASALDHAPTVFSVPGISAEGPSVLTIECVSQRGNWTGTDKGNLQYPLWTPRGSFCYRYDDGVALFCQKTLKKIGVLDARNVNPTAVRSHAAVLGYEEHALWIDGARCPLTSTETYTEDLTTSSDCKLITNKRADFRVKSLRLYNRRLTEEEIGLNAEIDAARFKGAAVPLVATGPFEPKSGVVIVIR